MSQITFLTCTKYYNHTIWKAKKQRKVTQGNDFQVYRPRYLEKYISMKDARSYGDYQIKGAIDAVSERGPSETFEVMNIISVEKTYS